MKNGINKKLNDALLKWFTLMGGNSIPINGAILLEKARDFGERPSIATISSIKRKAERLKRKLNDISLSFNLRFKPT